MTFESHPQPRRNLYWTIGRKECAEVVTASERRSVFQQVLIYNSVSNTGMGKLTLLGSSFPFIKRIRSASVISKASFVSESLCLQVMFHFTRLETFPLTYVLKIFSFIFHVLCLIVVCLFVRIAAKKSVLLISSHGIWVKTEIDKKYSIRKPALPTPCQTLWPVQANPSRDVEPFGISGPHWKKSCLGPHIKYIVTHNQKNLIMY